MKNLLYLHGLESKQGGQKVDFLASEFMVYAPALNYRTPGCFQMLFERIKNTQWDIIMGSSMGGFFAYELSLRLSVHRVILLNPALHIRSIFVDVSAIAENAKAAKKGITTKYELHLGKQDELIDPKQTLQFLNQAGVNFTTCQYDYGHRTPLATIVKAVEEEKS